MSPATINFWFTVITALWLFLAMMAFGRTWKLWRERRYFDGYLNDILDDLAADRRDGDETDRGSLRVDLAIFYALSVLMSGIGLISLLEATSGLDVVFGITVLTSGGTIGYWSQRKVSEL